MLTRRAFAVVVGSVPAALAAMAASEYEPWCGTLTVEGHSAYQRRTGKTLLVFVDGRDVTRHSFRANDRKGYAMVFKTDAHGRHYVGTDGRPAWELLKGDVRIVEKAIGMHD